MNPVRPACRGFNLLRWQTWAARVGRLGPVLVILAVFAGLAGFSPSLQAAAVALPPAPSAYFNDYAGYIPPARARALDARLAQFERDSSTQLVVAIFPRLPAGAALEDYTVRTAQAWGVGQKKRDNGAVLFVFVADRTLRIEVGYGLEGRLTDAVSHAIIENELKPLLRAGRPADALEAAVTAMIAATTGEYRGTGKTAADSKKGTAGIGGSDLMTLLWIGIPLLLLLSRLRKGYTYLNQNSRRRSRYDNLPWGGGGSGDGGSWGGGGSSSDGGGFSGGGGSFGGGGASGKW